MGLGGGGWALSAARLKSSLAGPVTAPLDEVPGQEAVCRAVHAFGVGLKSKPPASGWKLRCNTARAGTHSVLGRWAQTHQGRGHGRNSSALASPLALGSLGAPAGVPTKLISKEFKGPDRALLPFHFKLT